MRRHLKRGQIYTSHDGSKLYRQIGSITMVGDGIGEEVECVMYRTNRSEFLKTCQRHTFVAWIRLRKARKTQKNRLRQLTGRLR